MLSFYQFLQEADDEEIIALTDDEKEEVQDIIKDGNIEIDDTETSTNEGVEEFRVFTKKIDPSTIFDEFMESGKLQEYCDDNDITVENANYKPDCVYFSFKKK